MRRLLALLFVATLSSAVVNAQTTPASEHPEQPSTSGGQPASSANNPADANPLRIAPGSVIPVQLAKTIDAKKAKSGEEVVATVTQDMKTNDGNVLVPKDSRILGHVTEAQPRSKEQKESQVAISFDHAVVKGNQVQLPMSIQAIIAPASNDNRAAGNPGGDEGAGAPAGSPAANMGGGRPGAAGGSSAPPPQSNSPQGSAESQSAANARPAITGNTKGVIGMPNVSLQSNEQNAAQGSVVTSDKNNVKIEKGTMMLLRVD